MEDGTRALVVGQRVGEAPGVSINHRARPAVVPLLLAELEKEPDHWFWALKELTGENPVTSDSRGNVAEMAKC